MPRIPGRYAAAWIFTGLLSLPAIAGPAPDLSGEWHFEVSSQNGPGHRDVRFIEQDQRVIGFIESDFATGRFVGRVDGSSLEFTAVLEFGGQPMTTRVGSFAPTAWGLYDMVGNVWEWTGDWYRADYYEASPTEDPAGPDSGEKKVLRGCSW